MKKILETSRNKDAERSEDESAYGNVIYDAYFFSLSPSYV
jgi:hypothetical protein